MFQNSDQEKMQISTHLFRPPIKLHTVPGYSSVSGDYGREWLWEKCFHGSASIKGSFLAPASMEKSMGTHDYYSYF